MFCIKDSKTGIEYTTEMLNSGVFTAEYLQDLVNRSKSTYNGPNPAKLYCTCRNCCTQKRDFDMDSVRYSIQRNELGTYYPRPYRNNHGAGHATSCIKNPINHEYKTLNPAYQETEKDGKSIHSLINFASPARANYVNINHRTSMKNPPNPQEARGMIRSVFELMCLKSEIFFHDTALHGHIEIISNEDKLCLNPIQMKYNLCQKILDYDIKIGNTMRNILNKPMSCYTLEEDGFAFVYDVVANIHEAAVEWPNPKKTYVTIYTKSSSYRMSTWFYIMLKQRFSRIYSGREMEFNSDSYKLILAGSYQKRTDGMCWINKGTFLMVSYKYGLISESIHEAKFYDMAMDEMSVKLESSLYKRYKYAFFYKPYLFLPGGIYDGKGLPDGILQSRKTGKQCIIEIYGSRDAEYMKKRAKKEAWINAHKDDYDYFFWDICDNGTDFDNIQKSFSKIVEKYCNM